MDEEKRASNEDKRSFSLLYNGLPFALARLDENAVIIDINATMSELSGYASSALAGKSFSAIVSGKSPAEVRSIAAEVARRERESVTVTLGIVYGNESVHEQKLTLLPFEERARTSVLVLLEDAECEDTHKYLILKERAETALKTKSEFLAKMSHEIRTPIHSIVGITELLAETKLDDEQKEYLDRIQFSAESLLSIINDILDFSKIEAGKVTQEIRDFELHTVVENAVDMLTIEANKKSIDVQLYIDKRVPYEVRGDSDHIRQILVNLISNAIKFTQRGEILVSVALLRVEMDSYVVKFWIKDSGIGIPASQIPKLFKSFTQADNSTSRKYGGSGLGLAISKGLVELMGGRIGVKSKPGEGSIFHFTVVFGKAQGTLHSHDVPADLLKDHRILVASDDRTLTMILTHYIGDLTVRLDYAESGARTIEALEKAAEEGKVHDICIVDLRLPDMDGWQLASRINADKSINMTKLVLLSPKAMGSGEAKMKMLGWFNAFVGKPVKRRELVAALVRTTSTDVDLAPVSDTGATEDETDAEFLNEVLPEKDILVVEDNEINSQLFKTVLENIGMRVIIARDGIEAVKNARLYQFDLVFMDIQMPNMNGYDAARAIRSHGIKTPIVAVTANALKAEIAKAMDSGMDDYITKPFKKPDIVPLLRKWLTSDKIHGEEQVSVPKKDDAIKTEAFDFTAAIDNFMGKKELLVSLVTKFIANTANQIDSIETAIASGDVEKVRMEAHSIKGAAWNLTAKRLGDAAQLIEKAASEGRKDSITLDLSNLKKAFAEFRKTVSDIGVTADS